MLGSLVLLALLVGIVNVTVAPVPPRAAPANPEQRPNILIFYTDDQRQQGTMRALPKTRAIFRRGVRFPRSFVVTPQCCPARATMLSGQYPHNHGVTNNGGAPNFDPDQSWPYELRRAGYQVAFHGKYLHGVKVADLPNIDHSSNPEGLVLRHHPPRHDRLVANRTNQFIRQADGPWAAVLSFRIPHPPFRVQLKHRGRPVGNFRPSPAVRKTDVSDKNPQLRQSLQWPRWKGLLPAQVRRRQLRMLRTTDDLVEQVWNQVGALGQRRNTLVIFTSDNGAYWGEHGLTGKALPYLDSLRVPLLIRFGNRLEPGVDRRFALDVDHASTIMDAAGVEPEYLPDGRSLLDPGWDRRWVMFEGADRSSSKAMRIWQRAFYDGRRHYFRWKNGFRELYRLRRDPWQLDNALRSPRFAGSRPAQRRTARNLQARLNAVAQCRGVDECP